MRHTEPTDVKTNIMSQVRRRARKVLVPGHLKDAKYWARRRLNTECARRWRQARKRLCVQEVVSPKPALPGPFANIEALVDVAGNIPGGVDDQVSKLLDFPADLRVLLVNPIVQQCNAVHEKGIIAERLMIETIAEARRVCSKLSTSVAALTLAASSKFDFANMGNGKVFDNDARASKQDFSEINLNAEASVMIESDAVVFGTIAASDGRIDEWSFLDEYC